MDNINAAKLAQQQRMAGQSWDYLNQNDPLYPELIQYQGKRNPAKPWNFSVQEVRERLREGDQ